jgi:hypothetical protein
MVAALNIWLLQVVAVVQVAAAAVVVFLKEH